MTGPRLNADDALVLRHLRDAEWRVPRAEVADLLGIGRADASEVLDYLARHSLVKRYRDGWTVTAEGWDAADASEASP